MARGKFDWLSRFARCQCSFISPRNMLQKDSYRRITMRSFGIDTRCVYVGSPCRITRDSAQHPCIPLHSMGSLLDSQGCTPRTPKPVRDPSSVPLTALHLPAPESSPRRETYDQPAMLPRHPPERRAPLRNTLAHALDSHDDSYEHRSSMSTTVRPLCKRRVRLLTHMFVTAPTSTPTLSIALNSAAHTQHGSAPYNLAADPAPVHFFDARTTARTPSRCILVTPEPSPSSRRALDNNDAT
jgi:hypothetical protein